MAEDADPSWSAATTSRLLVTGVLVVVLLLFAAFGLLSRRWQGAGIAGFVVLGVVGLIANQSQYGAPATGILPILVGVLTWLALLGVLTASAPSATVSRRVVDGPATPLPARGLRGRSGQRRGRACWAGRSAATGAP